MKKDYPVTFGTDGWRGIIADDYTFDNLSIVAEATARYFKQHRKRKNGVVIGYDARFMSGDFAAFTAQVLGNRGIKVRLADTISSTPMVSLTIAARTLAGGVVITASHNPPIYNGFKLKEEYGGPAHPELVERLERYTHALIEAGKSRSRRLKPLEQLKDDSIVRNIDITRLYVEGISKRIDLKKIRSAGIRVAYDAMHGAGAGVPSRLLDHVHELRGEYNPSFGGINPEPLPQYLAPLFDAMKTGDYHIGIATDGDADRIGAVDEKGQFVDSHRIFAVLLKFLYEQKGWRGSVVKSFSVTELIDKMCKRYQLPLHVTPIGFKHICRHMVEGDVLIGGEESGGIGVKHYIPERDGIYIGLLLCEIIATRGKQLSELVEELMSDYGSHFYNRIDRHVEKKEQPRIMREFRKGFDKIAGYPVRRREDIDGHKFYIDNGWLLVRSSGTEPLIRYYAESDSPETVEKILRFATSV